MGTLKTVKCIYCGKEFQSRKIGTMCKECKSERKQERIHVNKLIKSAEEVETSTLYTKWDIRFDKAVDKLSKQVDISEYKRAIEILKPINYKFDSIAEVIFAISLIHDKWKIIPQQKIAGYKADFVCPNEKIVFEIDGAIYHTDKTKEYIRDYCIKNKLGSEWKIYHIPSEITNSIVKVHKYTELIRRKNGRY